MIGMRSETKGAEHLIEAITLAMKCGLVQTDEEHLERWKHLVELLSNPAFAKRPRKSRDAKRLMTADYGVITEIVEPGSRVLDLGCGGG